MSRYRTHPKSGEQIRIVYVGALPGVTISATGTVAPRGVPVSVPAAVAEQLLQQPTWKPAAEEPQAVKEES